MLSPRLRGYAGLAGTAVVAGLASGRPELVLLAVPILLLIVVGLVLQPDRPPDLRADVRLERTRLLEGEAALAKVVLRKRRRQSIAVEVELARSGTGTTALRLSGSTELILPFVISPQRWGAHTIGPVTARVVDPLRLTRSTLRLAEPQVVRVFPREQRLRQLIAPLRTQPFLGSHVSRARGEGIEFADIRPFVTGDRARRVNWRVTARRGALHVTERHAEQASDVVLLLDTFAQARDGAGGTLDAAVRAAAALARTHLAQRDRVALVDFGGTLQWLEPALGTVQLYRIYDALIASEVAFSYAWRAVQSIPRRVLPPHGVILAISPLLDQRSVRLIVELRRRGADVTVIEVSPLPYVQPISRTVEAVAYRLWRLRREALRAQLRAVGVGVAPWDESEGLGPAVEEVNSFRRSVRQLVRA